MDIDAKQPFSPPSENVDQFQRSVSRSLRTWIPVAVCLLALAAVPVAFFIGAVLGNTEVYQNMAEHQQARIESFLAQHPQSFDGLTVQHASNGWAYPIGTVPQQSDYELLADALQEMFGDELAERMLRPVVIESNP